MHYFFDRLRFFLWGFCCFLFLSGFSGAESIGEKPLKERIAERLRAHPENAVAVKLLSDFPVSEKSDSMLTTDISVAPCPEETGDCPEPNFWEQMVGHVKKADEFYNKRLKPEGENDKIRWFRPNIVHFDGFQWTIGNTISYRTNLTDLKTLALYFSYSPLQLKDPFSRMKMHAINFGFTVQDKLSRRWFSRFSGGVRRFVPNQGYRDFYAAMGQSFDDESIPYISFGFGYTIVENLFKMNRSLVWFAGYTMADDFNYPAPDPFGYTTIQLNGFFHGFSFSYKF